jgi:hypothetical protein
MTLPKYQIFGEPVAMLTFAIVLMNMYIYFSCTTSPHVPGRKNIRHTGTMALVYQAMLLNLGEEIIWERDHLGVLEDATGWYSEDLRIVKKLQLVNGNLLNSTPIACGLEHQSDLFLDDFDTQQSTRAVKTLWLICLFMDHPVE